MAALVAVGDSRPMPPAMASAPVAVQVRKLVTDRFLDEERDVGKADLPPVVRVSATSRTMGSISCRSNERSHGPGVVSRVGRPGVD